MKTLKKFCALLVIGTIVEIAVVGYINVVQFLFQSSTQTKLSFQTDDKIKHNIVFLKTHKTGGTTLQNILMRHGDVNNLTFVFFKSSDGLKQGRHFPADMVPQLISGKQYNIICRHARFDKVAMHSVMPNDTIYITLIRDPIMHFRSFFWYYDWPRILGISHVENPLVYFIDNMDEQEFADKASFPFNYLLFELGMQPVDMMDEIKVNETIQQLDKDFHLVMLTEYFDESLVLLRRILNWDLKEMIYFKMRVRNRESEILTKEQEMKIWTRSRLHSLLYDSFNTTLWRKITKHESDGFWEEVRELRRLKAKTMKNCVKDIGELVSPNGEEGNFHKIRDDAEDKPNCNRLVISPIFYTVYLIKKQLPFLLDKNISTFYSFVYRGFWKYSSWNPLNGVQENEDIFDRVCNDSGHEIENCRKEVYKLLH